MPQVVAVQGLSNQKLKSFFFPNQTFSCCLQMKLAIEGIFWGFVKFVLFPDLTQEQKCEIAKVRKCESAKVRKCIEATLEEQAEINGEMYGFCYKICHKC